MSHPTLQRSDLAGWAGYGYCASHSRFFWGLRLYLVSTPAGMPILWALANPKIGEREVLAAMLEHDAGLVAAHPGVLLISDKASRPSRSNGNWPPSTASSCCARRVRTRKPATANPCSRRSAS